MVEVVCPGCGKKRDTESPEYYVCSKCRKTINRGEVKKVGRPSKDSGDKKETEDPQWDELDKRFRTIYKALSSLKRQVLRSEGVPESRDPRLQARADIYWIKALTKPGNKHFMERYLRLTASIANCEEEENLIVDGYTNHDPKFDIESKRRFDLEVTNINNMLPDPPINSGIMCGAKQGAVTSGQRLEPLMMVTCKCGHNSRVKAQTAKELAELRCDNCKKKGTYKVVIAYEDDKTSDTDNVGTPPALQSEGHSETVEEARIPLQQIDTSVVARKEHGAEDNKDKEGGPDGVAQGPGNAERKRPKQERKGRRTGRRRGSKEGSDGQGNRRGSAPCCKDEDDATYRCQGGKRDNSLIE